MPKDPEAIACIGESFIDLLAFLKSNVVSGQKAFEKVVTEKLDKESRTVLGFKKALKFMLENFALRCGIVIRRESGDESIDCTTAFCNDYCKQVRRS